MLHKQTHSPAKGYIYGQLSLFGEAEVIGFGSIGFKVKEIPRKKANAIIKKHHYSKKFYNASTIHLGVYLDDNLVGVLQYGYAMNPASMGGVVKGTGINEYLELNRMWFKDGQPPNAKTQAISYSIKYIKRKHPGVKWIQSFADERCKKFGIVYQAANFLYCGEHSSDFWEIDGEYYHNSLMTRDPKLCPAAAFAVKNKNRAKKHTFRQFRYIYFIKKWCKKELLLKLRPYPKHYKEVVCESTT
jgi:hypothetical protein